MIEALAAAEAAEAEPADGGGGPDGGGLTDQVATLAAAAWLRLLTRLCDNLRRLLARVKVSTGSGSGLVHGPGQGQSGQYRDWGEGHYRGLGQGKVWDRFNVSTGPESR